MPQRLTLDLGVRFDRFRRMCPRCSIRSAGGIRPRFASMRRTTSTRGICSPSVRRKLGRHRRQQERRQVQLRRFTWYDPGFGLAGNLTPNSNNGLWNRRFAWTDPNSNGVFDVGEQGRLIANQGGTASTALDPNLEDQPAHEVARGMSAHQRRGAWRRDLARDAAGVCHRQFVGQSQSAVQRVQRAGDDS